MGQPKRLAVYVITGLISIGNRTNGGQNENLQKHFRFLLFFCERFCDRLSGYHDLERRVPCEKQPGLGDFCMAWNPDGDRLCHPRYKG